MKNFRLFSFLLVTFVFVTPVMSVELSNAQKVYIDQWLVDNGFNRFGDPEGTIYPGGSPLFDETTGQVVDRYEYVLKRHPKLLKEITNKDFDPGELLRRLETKLEMAYKDLALEQNSPRPDKRRIRGLLKRIEELKHSVSLTYVNADRGILPEIFQEEVKAALDSSDYLRLAELVSRLKDQGADAVKYQAENLFYLSRQLRFRLLDQQIQQEKAARIKQVLKILQPLLDSLKV